MPEAERSGPHTRNHAPGAEGPKALPATLLQRAVDLALQIALSYARPLVVQLLAAAQTQQQLHAAVLVEIQLQGHQRHAAHAQLGVQVGDLLAMQQQLAAPIGVAVEDSSR